MLNALREGTGASVIKYVALGFVLLASLGMIFMDVGGFFRGGFTDTTLARIGRTKIDLQNFERTAAPAVRAQNMSMQEAYRFGLLQNLLDEMVMREALRQEAIREGLLVGRNDLATRVHDLIKAQVQPGETPQAALNRILRTQGISEGELTNGLRQNLVAGLMEQPLKASVQFVPKLATEALGRFQAERRDIMFFTLTPEGVGANIKADDESLKAYYETIKDQYQIPEERTFKALVLSTDDVKDTIKLTDADVKAAYEERKDQFRAAERRKIEQAVFSDEGKAKEVGEKIRKGGSLKALSGNAYREPNEVEQSTLPQELAPAVFSAAKGIVLNPIQTPLGWHVIRVIDMTPARTQAFQEVRGDLRKELESDALHDEMESRISKVDEALSNGDSLDQIAQAQGLALRTVGPIDRNGNFTEGQSNDPMLAALAQNKDLISSLFELMEGEAGDLAEVNENLYAVFTLEKVAPSRDRDFAEIRAQIEKKWLDEQRNAALNSTIDNLMQQFSQEKKDFAQAAREANAVLKTARDVSRESKVAGLNDPVALTRLFDETDLKAVVKVPTDKGVILAKVLAARIPEAGKGTISPESEKQWRMQMEQAVGALFLADLRERNKAKINEKLLEKTYGTEADVE